MSDYPPGEFINPTENSERTRFREKILRLFSSKELGMIVNEQFPLRSKEYIILVRGSDQLKENQKPRVRSWSTGLVNAGFYINHRILRFLEEQELKPNMGWYVNLPALKPQANPIIKLLNKKYVPKESVKPGIEGGEAEIDESLLDPENVVDITSVDQLVELKNILLAHADPNVPEVKFVFRYIDSLIRQFNEIERIKKVIETRDFQKGQSIA